MILMDTLLIRNARLEDADHILNIYANYIKNTAVTFEYDVPGLSEFQERMRHTMKRYPYLVIERDGQIEGYAYAGRFIGRAAYDWACELTIYLDHNVCRRGMGRNTLTKTAPISMPVWDFRRLEYFRSADTNSAAGTI